VGDILHCLICKQGETQPGIVTAPLQRGDNTIIFKNVHADVCQNCGEYYLDDATTNDLLARAKQAISRGAEVEIIRLAA